MNRGCQAGSRRSALDAGSRLRGATVGGLAEHLGLGLEVAATLDDGYASSNSGRDRRMRSASSLTVRTTSAAGRMSWTNAADCP